MDEETSFPQIMTTGNPTFTITEARPGLSRAHTLPFRLPSFPTLKSIHSPDSTSTSSANSSPQSSSPISLVSLPTSAEQGDNQMDMDMDMDAVNVDIRGSQSPVSPFQVPNRPPKIIAPPRLQEGSQFGYGRLPTPISLHSQTSSPHSQFATARIPTPIHPHFPMTPSPSLNYPNGLMMSPSQPSTSALFNGHSPIRMLPNHSPSRGMPSPIREDIMDEANPDYAGNQFSKLSVSESMMDVDENISNEHAIDSSTNPGKNQLEITIPPRTGRARSGAMLSANKRIFMGYMPDCEKCRLKVPGHSVHIIPA